MSHQRPHRYSHDTGGKWLPEMETEDHIHASLGEIVIGEKPGREDPDEITVFKSCGLAIQDIATARVIYEAAVARGVGTRVEL